MSSDERTTPESTLPPTPPPPKGVKLAALIPGYVKQGKPWPVYMSPSLGSDDDGQIRWDFEEPDPSTVDRYDNTLHGLGKKNRGKPSEWGAVAHVIETKFQTIVGVDPEDEQAILDAYGDWKNALLKNPALRGFAKTGVNLYIASCRVNGSVKPDEEAEE